MSLLKEVSRFIYYPEPDWVLTPDRLGLKSEELQIASEPGVTLHAWFFPVARDPGLTATGLLHPGTLGTTWAEPRGKPLATLFFCHGNAGNVSHRLENVYYLVQCGFQVLLFDYRGYGHSTGQPSEEGLYLDAEAAWGHLVSRVDTASAPRLIFGRSLGGAVAVDLACRAQADGLVLESTFTSIRTLTRLLFPIPLPRLPVKFDSVTKIRSLKMPLLAIHGQEDELIPYVDGQALFAAAPEPKTWSPIPGAGHNNTYAVGGAAYFQKLAEFAGQLSR